MSLIAHSLVKRGVDIIRSQEPSQQTLLLEFPKWGLVMLLLTTVVFGFIWFGIRYTYGELVATLTMIETPTATAIIRTAPPSDELDAKLPGYSKTEDEITPLIEQELLIVKTKPITSKFSTTIAHLRSQAGYLSRFRGIHVFAIYGIAFHCYDSLVYSFFHHSPAVRCLVNIFTSVVFCRLRATWTHIVISKPSEKRWYQRYLSRDHFRKLVGPAFIAAALQQASLAVPIYLFKSSNLRQYVEDPNKLAELTPEMIVRLYMNILSIVIVFFISVICVVIPAEAALTRVQASLLPEEDGAIVPFDRTFNGKVVPEILGGKGCVGLAEAWKSFDREARFRLFGVYAKLAAIDVALSMFYCIVVLAEVRFMLGDQLDKVVMAAVTQGR